MFKKFILGLFLVLGFFTFSVTTAKASDYSYDKDDSIGNTGKIYVLEVGDTFDVRIGYGLSPYSFDPVVYNSSVLSLVEEIHSRGACNRNSIESLVDGSKILAPTTGCGGIEIWKFKAVGTGDTNLKITMSPAGVGGNTSIEFDSTFRVINSSNSKSGRVYDFGLVTLRDGSSGESVMELQRFLNDTLNLGLVVDGKLGPKTIDVIKKWQEVNGLVADGLVGVKTKEKMNASVQ